MPGYPTYFQPYGSPAYPRMDYPQQAPQMAVQPPPVQGGTSALPAMQTGFQCRPVTSREEAMAVQAEYFGPGTLMPDLGHGMVYLKRFNPNTGASDLFDFAIVQPAQESAAPGAPDYTEMIQSLGSQVERMSGKLDALFEKLEPSGKGDAKEE